MGYIDPGAFGLVTQIGYIVLFALVSAFMFFFGPIKRAVRRVFHRAESEADVSKYDETHHV